MQRRCPFSLLKQLISSSRPSQRPAAMSTGKSNDWKSAKSVYDFTVKDIDGKEVSLDKFKGHPALVVNVASQCGLTKKNYQQLNDIYDKYQAQGFKILAFPCNQFGNQEPGCSVDIKEFAKKNHIKFDMFDKVDVNGDNADPVWKWLKKQKGGFLGMDGIKWNFTKFLVDKNGVPVKRFAPTDEPASFEGDIKSQL